VRVADSMTLHDNHYNGTANTNTNTYEQLLAQDQFYDTDIID